MNQYEMESLLDVMEEVELEQECAFLRKQVERATAMQLNPPVSISDDGRMTYRYPKPEVLESIKASLLRKERRLVEMGVIR